MTNASGADVRAEHVSKRYGTVTALRDASLEVCAGEAVAVTGRSGSGKSTLLGLIGGLEQPDGGRVLIDGQPLWQDQHLSRARREVVGFVFQRHLLLPTLSAQANVEVPLIGAGVHRRERHARALELLEAVGLEERAAHLPSELSGGERQRVAIARALANRPRLLLADEPTGALDSTTSERVLDLIFGLRDEFNMTVIVVSYDAAVGARADRSITVIDGVVGATGAPAAAGATTAATAPAAPGVPGVPAPTPMSDGHATPADGRSAAPEVPRPGVPASSERA